MVRTLIGETPFLLAFKSKAVTLVELILPMYRVSRTIKDKNEENLLLNLDLLEGRRQEAAT